MESFELEIKNLKEKLNSLEAQEKEVRQEIAKIEMENSGYYILCHSFDNYGDYETYIYRLGKLTYGEFKEFEKKYGDAIHRVTKETCDLIEKFEMMREAHRVIYKLEELGIDNIPAEFAREMWNKSCILQDEIVSLVREQGIYLNEYASVKKFCESEFDKELDDDDYDDFD